MTDTGLALLARLLEYPGPDFPELVRACARPEAGRDLAAFAGAMGALSVAQAQELYIQTFDWNPDTTLDISWHLFGENYDRGEFLVKMRQRLRRYGVAESTELPDYLPRVLALVERMPEDESARLTGESLMPAMAKIAEALGKTASPYLHLIRAAERLLGAKFPAAALTEVSND
ncbi:MAG: nitrate reductase molybdenum cofactor assembly chaperone [Bryobacterales bacterium]|nr:nitrate reductase molybdenum cofactor assembly chaperone [Bryobacterales bacterium]